MSLVTCINFWRYIPIVMFSCTGLSNLGWREPHRFRSHVWRQSNCMTMISQYVINSVDIFLGFLEELTVKSLLLKVSYDTVPYTGISCLFLLCKLTVVCQPGDSDGENYLEHYWLRRKVGRKFLGSPLLKICCIHLSMVVSCFKSSLVNKMCTEGYIHQFPLHAACFLRPHEHTGYADC